MKIAISNIAWEASEDDAVIDVLHRHRVKGVELAPTKWRDKPFDAPAREIEQLRRRWNDAGLEIVSLQSLLFGRPDLQLFGDNGPLADYMRRVIDFAAAVGAGAMVFGSPKNRTRGDLPMADAMRIATDFFADLAPYAAERGTSICVEANPPAYGCDFITTTSEALTLARAVNHPGVAINVDLGGITMSNEDPRTEIEAARDLIGHVHASEPNLGQLGASADHVRAADALRGVGYRRWVSIEMRPADADGHPVAVERAVRRASSVY